MNKKIIIYSPIFCRNSAGVYALYKLASDLKQRGNIVLTTIWNANYVLPSIYDVPIIPNIVAKQLIQEYNFTVIYPEVISGNPLGAKNVIRWIMNRPGLLGGEPVFDAEEKIFMYGDQYDQYVKNSITGYLTLPTIDFDMFKYNQNIEKTDITVYTGKREFRQGYIDHYDNLITRTSPAHDKVAEILKKTKILYSFDCVSNILNEARIAGCNVVLINDGYMKNGKYTSEFGEFGVKMIDKFNGVLEQPDIIFNAVKIKYEELIKEYMNQLDIFEEYL